MSQTTQKQEFFRVDIIFSSGTNLLNVEIPQSTLDWYAANAPNVLIVPAGLEIPKDIVPVDDPIDIIEEPVVPISPEVSLIGAIRVEFKDLTYISDPDLPQNSLVIAKINLVKTGQENLGIFKIIMKVSGLKSGIGFSITEKSTNILGRHSLITSFKSESARDIKAEIFIISGEFGQLALAQDKTARFKGITSIGDLPPDRFRPEPISPLLPIIGAGAAIAFLFPNSLKKKRRR